MKSALWPTRWPVIALQECVDKVDAAPSSDVERVKFELPCRDCPEKGRCLLAKRKEIGTLLYDREMMAAPRTSESSLLPFTLFKPMVSYSNAQQASYRKTSGLEARFSVVQAWDLAYSERVGGDWLVCMTGLLDRWENKRYLLEVDRWQQVSFDDQCEMIETKAKLFNAEVVVIESDAAQNIWTQHLRRTRSSVPVMPHRASQKRDFRVGVPGLIIQLENKMWSFPYKEGSHNRQHMTAFFDEAEAFGWVDGKLEGVGEHDDTVMAWWHLAWGMELMAGNQRKDRGSR